MHQDLLVIKKKMSKTAPIEMQESATLKFGHS
jgi:hypothetical protein